MMQDFFDTLSQWTQNGDKVALARVIKTWGSSPRPAGSLMWINADGQMAGSVSGGCVEGAVVKKSLAAIPENTSHQLAYGVSDDDAWSVGLSCGGRIQVYLQTIDLKNDPVWQRVLDNTRENRSCILISSLEDGSNRNALIDHDDSVIGDDLPAEVLDAARQSYRDRTHQSIEHDGVEYFIQLFPRKPLLLVVGAAHVTVDLVSFGKQFGFETVVVDPRGFFARNVIFHDAPDRIVEAYPSEMLNDYPLDAYTFCAILSHDPKIDDNALQILLKSDVAYIGALGSKKTHAKRTARLLDHGFDQETIDRISAPIGLPIRAKSAKEIAFSIMGQILEVKNRYLVR